ncbi:MAG: hypothetical protein WKF37_04220 [Bryobacteraceae bacterium]
MTVQCRTACKGNEARGNGVMAIMGALAQDDGKVLFQQGVDKLRSVLWLSRKVHRGERADAAGHG